MVVVSMALRQVEETGSVSMAEEFLSLSNEQESSPAMRVLTESKKENNDGELSCKPEISNSNKLCNSTLSMLGTQNGQEHLKKLLSLQLDLIEHQQIKITRKDKQLIMLKSEKEQLEARLSRMERRLALHKRHSLEVDDFRPKVSVTQKNTPQTGLLLKKDILGDRPKLTPSTPVTVTSRTFKAVKVNSYLTTDKPFLDGTNIKFLSNVKEKPKEELNLMKEAVSVPPWKVVSNLNSNLTTSDSNHYEDLSNETFIKRHMKPEIEERKRKRWDLQLLRQQRQHEMLEQKYKERERKARSHGSFDENDSKFLKTLYKNADNAFAIEVSDKVPVCVFGYPVPTLESSEMELPWFSITKRENQLRNSKQKVNKGKRK